MTVVQRAFLLICLGLFASSPGLRADEHIGDELGVIQFEVHGKPDVQAQVLRGVKLLHHMMYPEADRAFAEALSVDDQTPIAYWGRAMSLLHPLWPDAPTAAELKQGAEFLRRGLACANVSARDRSYLETLDVYYRDATTEQHVDRLSALDAAWTKLIEQYPNDLDGLAFSALFHLAPARFHTKDKSHRLQLESAARLQQVLAKLPTHPGALHYKIHAYDFPLLADRALEVCETYGGIAPDVPHALHMPTHIYTRRGLWEKSIDFNRRSAEAARKLGETAGTLNGHYPHALDYLTYAYLQRGQYQEAEKIREQLTRLQGPYSQVQPTAMAFAFAAIPARCALERQNWTLAAELPLHQPAAFPWTAAYLNCDSITRFARALGAARSGRLEAARAEMVQQEKLWHELAAERRASYWVSQAETQLLAVGAWVAFGEGKQDEAIALMKRAAGMEASIDKEAVTPGEVLPAGDLLGDLLLECGRQKDALATFEAVLQSSPNRLNTLYGAGFAAERSGDDAKARQYFEQLLAVAPAADSGIPRIEHARAFVQKHAVALK
ncbi:MAG: hypothetical protein ABIZ04_20665 [Opitutus sp.]